MTAPACEHSYYNLYPGTVSCPETSVVHLLFKNRMTGQESVGSFCDQHWTRFQEGGLVALASWEGIPLEHRLLLDVLLA